MKEIPQSCTDTVVESYAQYSSGETLREVLENA
jgi:hypothetical protein